MTELFGRLLGSLRPSDAWLDALCAASLSQLPAMQPAQLWGLLQGLARLRHVPPADWMAAHLAAVASQVKIHYDLCTNWYIT